MYGDDTSRIIYSSGAIVAKGQIQQAIVAIAHIQQADRSDRVARGTGYIHYRG